MKLAILVYTSLETHSGSVLEPHLRPYDEVQREFKERVASGELPPGARAAGLYQMEIWTARGGRVKRHRFDPSQVRLPAAASPGDDAEQPDKDAAASPGDDAEQPDKDADDAEKDSGTPKGSVDKEAEDEAKAVVVPDPGEATPPAPTPSTAAVPAAVAGATGAAGLTPPAGKKRGR